VIRLFLTAIALLALAGCASLMNAGSSSYIVKTYPGTNGAVACCELTVLDGKEYSSRNVAFQTTGTGASLVIQEGASKAFKGQAIAAKAATVFPVTGLQDLIKP
jgi:hypothetical protein